MNPVSSRMSYEAVNKYYGYTTENAVVLERPADYAYFTNKDGNDQISQFDADYSYVLQDPFYHNSNYSNSINDKLGDIRDELRLWEDTDREVAHTLTSHLELLTAVNRQVTACNDNQENGDERHAFVAATFSQYQEVNPFAEDETWDDNFDRTIDFLCFYEGIAAEKAQSHSWAEKISNWRALYADYIEAGNSVTEQSIARAVLAIRTVPIFIVDPLTALIDKAKRGGSLENLGVFDGVKRTLHIDPFTIESTNNPQYPDIGVRSTLIHELWHVATNTHYTMEEITVGWDINDNPINIPRIVAQGLWPRWWREGMTEKHANIVSSVLASEEELMLARTLTSTSETYNDKELRWRKARAGDTRESLTNEEALELRKINAASYKEYRLLIDAFFAKLDWQAAGLDITQIEEIATQAFSETPEDGSSSRMAFIAAVNKAAHPGFFMKLQHGVDLHGVQPITDMLLDPAFDPHDPQAFIFIATAQYHDHLKSGSPLAAIEGHIERVRDTGASPSENDINYLHKLQKDAGRAELLAAAIKGQRTLLKAHEPPTRESKLLDAIFGDEARQRQQNDEAAAQRAIDRWRDDLATLPPS